METISGAGRSDAYILGFNTPLCSEDDNPWTLCSESGHDWLEGQMDRERACDQLGWDSVPVMVK